MSTCPHYFNKTRSSSSLMCAPNWWRVSHCWIACWHISCHDTGCTCHIYVRQQRCTFMQKRIYHSAFKEWQQVVFVKMQEVVTSASHLTHKSAHGKVHFMKCPKKEHSHKSASIKVYFMKSASTKVRFMKCHEKIARFSKVLFFRKGYI